METEGRDNQAGGSCQTAKKLKPGENWNLVFGDERNIN